MNESAASFLIFRIKIRPLRGKLAAMAQGCGGYSSFGNNAVTFSRKPQRLRELIIEHRSPDHWPAPPARTALNVPCLDGLSPTSGENSTSPVIKSAVSNF